MPSLSEVSYISAGANSNATLRERVVTIALGQKGTLAKFPSRTWGDNIGKYLEAIGLPQGHDYCVAFIYWCFKKAAEGMGQKNPMPKVGLVSALYKFGKNNGMLISSPQRGDIYITETFSHAGIIEVTPTDLSSVSTIEGNTYTNDRNAKNHDWGVHPKTKNLENAYFLRL